jgi:hypothetical protein
MKLEWQVSSTPFISIDWVGRKFLGADSLLSTVHLAVRITKFFGFKSNWEEACQQHVTTFLCLSA